MTEREDRLLEVLRLVAAIAAGGILILVQRWLFTSGRIPLVDVNPILWVSGTFIVASLIVFVVSAISGVLWYIMALNMNPSFAPKDTRLARAKWAGFLLVPLSTIIGNLWIFGENSPGALPWLAGFLVINLVFTFWLSTAISTPAILAHVVLFAPVLRNILRID